MIQDKIENLFQKVAGKFLLKSLYFLKTNILNVIRDLRIAYFETESTHFIKFDSLSMKVSNSGDSTDGIAPPDTGAAATTAGASKKV